MEVAEFLDWGEAEPMTLEEIRALGHQWKPSETAEWVICDCGAMCPTDLVENGRLFRKLKNSKSILTTPHVQAEVD